MQEQEGRQPRTVNTDTPVLGLLPTCYIWLEGKEFLKNLLFSRVHTLIGWLERDVVWYLSNEECMKCHGDTRD